MFLLINSKASKTVLLFLGPYTVNQNVFAACAYKNAVYKLFEVYTQYLIHWLPKLIKSHFFQGKARSDMTVEERIEAADRRKAEGNAYFKEEKLEEAIQQYEMVTDVLFLWLLCLEIMWFTTYSSYMSGSDFWMFCFLIWQAIAYMGDDFMFQLFGKYRDMALAVKNPCHLNMAACMIKLKRYEEAIGQCSIVGPLLLLVFNF